MNTRNDYSREPHREYREGREALAISTSEIALVYYPSSFEEELESKIEALEKHMLSLAQSIEKLVDKLSGKDIPGLPGRY
jgi:hypothetical protein